MCYFQLKSFSLLDAIYSGRLTDAAQLRFVHHKAIANMSWIHC